MFGPDILYQFMISVVLTICSVLTSPAQAESDKCSKCLDSEGNKCDDMERFEQSNYWIPTEDALGFGVSFHEAEKGCIQRGFTIAEFMSGTNDLERVFKGTGFDAFWMVKRTGDELKPEAVNKQGNPTHADLDTRSSYICQFTDTSGCLQKGQVMEQVQTTEKIATTEKEKIATTEKISNAEKISTTEKISTAEKISTTENSSTAENSSASSKPAPLPKNRRKCTNLLHGNRLSLRSRK